MILRLLGLQTLLDRLFDEGWCMHIAPEAIVQSTPDATEWV